MTAFAATPHLSSGVMHAGACAKLGLDLSKLDPEPSQLDLAIEAPEEVDRSVGPSTAQVAGAI
jgi:hypothetical protein